MPSTPELRSVKVQKISMTDDETVTPNSRSVEVQTTSVKDDDDDENVTQTNSDLPSRLDKTKSEDRASTAGKIISILHLRTYYIISCCIFSNSNADCF